MNVGRITQLTPHCVTHPDPFSNEPITPLGPGLVPPGLFKEMSAAADKQVESQARWDRYFLSMAHLVASKSKDRSTKVGAVIVGPNRDIRATGYNGFPRGVNDDVEDRHARPAKYMWTEHAERNALYAALQSGASVEGCTMYMNYAPYPCCDCTRGVIQAGIFEIVTSSVDFPGLGNWAESLAIGGQMLKEAGVLVRHVQFDPSKGVL